MDYEARRLANVQRNAEALQALGLLRAPPPTAAPAAARRAARARPPTRTTTKRRSARLRGNAVRDDDDDDDDDDIDEDEDEDIDDIDEDDVEEPRVPRRKRTRATTAKSAALATSTSSASGSARRKRIPAAREALSEKVQGDGDQTLTFAPLVRAEVSKGNKDYDEDDKTDHAVHVALSAKEGGAVPEVDARADAVEQDWVGKIVYPSDGRSPPKQTVLHALGAKRPRFNKYSGVQTFRNCQALFVNATPVANHFYANLFRREAASKAPRLFFSWFTQARQTLETPVVQQLASGALPVYLFVRLPARHYFCVGRVSVAQVIAHENHGVQFWWVVERAAQLAQNPIFAQLVEEMGTSSADLLAPFRSLKLEAEAGESKAPAPPAEDQNSSQVLQADRKPSRIKTEV